MTKTHDINPVSRVIHINTHDINPVSKVIHIMVYNSALIHVVLHYTFHTVCYRKYPITKT